MAQRLNTVIIVPHSQAKFFKFSFSTRTAVFVAVACVATVLLSVVAIVTSGGAVSRRAEVARLRVENSQLAEVNQRLQETVVTVQGRLDEFEERTSRLALAAGMDTGPVEFGDRSVSAGGAGSGGPYDRVPGSPEILSLQGDLIHQQLTEVARTIEEQVQTLSATPSIAPVAGLMTDGYGRRLDPFTGRRAFHKGLDISARRGTPVQSPADGVVVFTGRNGGLGKTVRIAHGFGFTTVYGHLDTIAVQPGDTIRRGEELGALGNSGRSTGPHLHYEVHVDGEAVNPLYYMLGSY